jgi:uncharacterized protein YPO0396
MRWNMLQNSLIDFSDDGYQKGFRLHRLEVINWGTFDQSVWTIEPQGFNSLLTGDIGSGKSTLVDAVTTLLVPHKKITFNKAAGAERKERSFQSYVLGSHKSERDEYNNSKPVNLRDEKDYSVILSYFYNHGFDKGMTLAQVFWVNNGNVNKFFVTSKQNLTIQDNFSLRDDEGDIQTLKKQLKNLSGTEVFDTFKDYSNSFRPFFGIKINSDKVFELFYQTVSMKSIDKLTTFMRDHMLEEVDFKSEIRDMIKDYDNVTRAYESVKKAKEQLDMLVPMQTDISKYEDISMEIGELRRCLDYLPYFFTEIKQDLLSEDIISFRNDLAAVNEQIIDIKESIKQLRDKERDLSIAISQDKEGQRIQELNREIDKFEDIKESKYSKQQEYSKLCNSVGIKIANNDQSFTSSIEVAKDLLVQVEEQLEIKIQERSEAFSSKEQLQKEYDQNEYELKSLNERKTKIPARNLAIRTAICKHCSLIETDLPFVGELIKVKSSEKEWEGSLERLLHNFGLSLLVPEEHYRTISKYVNQTDLNGRLVYFKVPNNFIPSSRNEDRDNLVIDKVEIKTDSEFNDWIHNELITKYDLVCCEIIEQFQDEKKAITKKGQIKGSGGRHEKDDRMKLFDRREFVLGWDNKEKIESIEEKMKLLHQQIRQCISEQEQFKAEGKVFEKQKVNLHDLLKIKDFDMIDWEKPATKIHNLKKEIEDLKQASSQLKILNEQLSVTKEQITKEDEDKTSLEKEESKIQYELDKYEDALKKCKTKLNENPFKENEKKPDISPYLKTDTFCITSIDQQLYNTHKDMDKLIENKNKKKENLGNSITAKMSRYKETYLEETLELTAEIESISEFTKIYKKLKEENLPKYEEDFKKELQEHAIKSIASFKAKLEDEVKNIKKNIKTINRFLHDLEYNKGTYIELRTDDAPESNIKEFKEYLKDCLAETFGNEDIYNEERFHRVKRLLDKFKSADIADNNWTNRVTDVRNWLIFSAAEKSCTDDSEIEFYSDSSGKSGGQKEKLAYTILASALAYRFGPAGDQPESNSFRFVIIDEAFGRSSDESARYGLELFKKLNLQLLVVTPLQKINVVEDYINFIHLVSNNSGEYSEIKNLTIKQYNEDKPKQNLGAMI